MSCIDHNTVRRLTNGRTKIIIVHGRCWLSNGESRLPQIQPKTDTNKTENQNHCAAKGKAIAQMFCDSDKYSFCLARPKNDLPDGRCRETPGMFLLQFNHGHTALALTITAQPKAFYHPVSA